MDYYKVTFQPPEGFSEILIAFLGDEGFDMFEELSGKVIAYLPAQSLTEAELVARISSIPQDVSGTGHSIERIAARNWNQEWESSFQPVEIAGKVVIRAPFHSIDVPSGAIDLVIEPKMSFGTGHHATTALMVQAMLDYPFQDARVLDMGCGSGVLAILAERLGASEIVGIDIDDWAVNNSEENLLKNQCSKITVRKGNASAIGSDSFDYILANINRNILLLDLPNYLPVLNPGGRLFISGFLTEDVDVLNEAAKNHGLTMEKVSAKDNWSQIVFVK